MLDLRCTSVAVIWTVAGLGRATRFFGRSGAAFCAGCSGASEGCTNCTGLRFSGGQSRSCLTGYMELHGSAAKLYEGGSAVDGVPNRGRSRISVMNGTRSVPRTRGPTIVSKRNTPDFLLSRPAHVAERHRRAGVGASALWSSPCCWRGELRCTPRPNRPALPFIPASISRMRV